MANSRQAEKRIRQSARRTAVNSRQSSRYRTFVKKVEAAIETGDKTEASGALKLAQPVMHSAVSKGIIHRNTVNRKLSRLARRVNAMA
ncbi:MAG: 30S ribosomal protein S20 [Alphaproteobacteria bacterium]|jgi:small subunit ribosomal protein S20